MNFSEVFFIVQIKIGGVLLDDNYYMNMALDLAAGTLGQTSPNPAVGAVIVKNNKIIGLGAHLKAGESHAEAIALEMAGGEAKGATIYVTLEPCSHIGKTGSCADAIIENDLKEVHIATLDPNEKVSGQGLEKLKNAGIKVTTGLLEDRAKEINKNFFTSMLHKRPFITLKQATSLDGKIATYTGESKWITSSEARIEVHKDRRLHDSILVGVNTVIKDNPELTVRLTEGDKQPIRLILDTHLRTPITSKIITDNKTATWIFTGNNVEHSLINEFETFQNVKVFQLESSHIDLTDVLDILHKREVRSIYVEGGSTVNGSFLKEGLIDEVFTYLAPILIGGATSPTSFRGLGVENLADAFELEIKEVKQIGKDLKIISQRVGS